MDIGATDGIAVIPGRTKYTGRVVVFLTTNGVACEVATNTKHNIVNECLLAGTRNNLASRVDSCDFNTVRSSLEKRILSSSGAKLEHQAQQK